jgi:hypothetical protein
MSAVTIAAAAAGPGRGPGAQAVTGPPGARSRVGELQPRAAAAVTGGSLNVLQCQ